MLQKLGPIGILGTLFILAGIVAIATQNLVIAVGMALVVSGFGMLAKAGLDAVMGLFGMA